jgi:hypothetical protein
MTVSEMARLVAEISQALDAPIQWVEDQISMREHGGVAHTGREIQNDGGGWVFILVDFPVEGTTQRGVSGTAARLGTIVRLTPELARKALDRARPQPKEKA